MTRYPKLPKAAEARRVLSGHIDILVNNAGLLPSSTTTATTDEATFDEPKRRSSPR